MSTAYGYCQVHHLLLRGALVDTSHPDGELTLALILTLTLP